MKCGTFLMAGLASAAVAGMATADTEMFFDVSGPGGNGNTMDFEADGALAGMNIAFDFTNAGGYTWAGDLFITIVDPNGTAIQYGGYNLDAGYTNAGDFDSSFDTSTSGAFASNVALESFGLSGSGTWTIGFYDGYTGGAETDNWAGVINLEGLGAVPAPGALALLGLAGLAGRRRRA